MIVALTDTYGNKVNTNPGIAVEIMSGYANDSSGPLDYMYHKSLGTLESNKFKVKSGAIGKIKITNAGSNYATAPTVSYSGGDSAFQGTATLSKYGSIYSVDVINSGSEYTEAPSVIAVGKGSDFIATANLTTLGSFKSITVDNQGLGYTSTPTVSANGGGTGFSAEATLEPTGSIKSITIDNAGTGYAVGDVLPVEGDGTGASIKVTAVATGVITDVAVFNKGEGYSYATIDTTTAGSKDARFTLSIGYKVESISLINTGSGYSDGSITVSGGTPDENAVASGILSYGVDSITIISGGSGYQNPYITISGDGKDAYGVETVKFSVDYVTIDNPGSGYVDGNLTFTPVIGDTGSGAAASIVTFDTFANVDEDNYKLALFGDGYVYNASGKWDFTHVNAVDINELVMIDSYDGNTTDSLGFAVGNNYRQDSCIFGKEWVSEINSIGEPIFDSNGIAEIEISYDYYLAAKDVVVMANLVGTQNDLGEKMRLGEATKHTLRGNGIIAPEISFQKGVSYATFRFYITLDETVEPLRNSNFFYNLEVIGQGVIIHEVHNSMMDGISECRYDTDGNKLDGRAYVDVTLSSPEEDGSIILADLEIVKEFN